MSSANSSIRKREARVYGEIDVHIIWGSLKHKKQKVEYVVKDITRPWWQCLQEPCGLVWVSIIIVYYMF